MRTAIVYYSQHHGNTKKLLDAIALQEDVTLINAAEAQKTDLTGFDCIGFASGIYFASFAKQLLSFAQERLPNGKNVFLISTCGFQSGVYFQAIRKIIRAKKCHELGAYQCLGYDTFGPFRLAGGLAKGRPNAEDIENAVRFYRDIKNTCSGH